MTMTKEELAEQLRKLTDHVNIMTAQTMASPSVEHDISVIRDNLDETLINLHYNLETTKRTLLVGDYEDMLNMLSTTKRELRQALDEAEKRTEAVRMRTFHNNLIATSDVVKLPVPPKARLEILDLLYAKALKADNGHSDTVDFNAIAAVFEDLDRLTAQVLEVMLLAEKEQ